MRTFVIFPKDRAEKIEASTKVVAIKRFMAKHAGVNMSQYSMVAENYVDELHMNMPEVTEIKEQGVVITETPKGLTPGEKAIIKESMKENDSLMRDLAACDP